MAEYKIQSHTYGDNKYIYAPESSNVTRPQCTSSISDITIQPLVDDLRANRLAFLPADQIIIEKTTDGGTTWEDAQVNDAVKLALFSQTRPSVSIPKINNEKNILCGLRVTFTAMKYNVPANTPETQKYNYWNSTYVASQERYNKIREMYFWVSSNSDTITVKLERANGATPNNWVTAFEKAGYGMTGWSGNDYIRFNEGVFGGSVTQVNQYWNYRLTFFTAGPNGSSTLSGTNMTSGQVIHEIRGYGTAWWGAGNYLASKDHLYTWNANKEATFPAQVTATNFVGKINNKTVSADVPANAVFTDESVTSVNNHYTPSSTTYKQVSASGGSASWNTSVLTGIRINTDAKGHIVSVEGSSVKTPSNTGLVTQVSGTTGLTGTVSGGSGSIKCDLKTEEYLNYPGIIPTEIEERVYPVRLDKNGKLAVVVPWTSSGGGGTTNYSDLTNKPQINSVTLSGNKSLSDLGIAPASDFVVEYETTYTNWFTPDSGITVMSSSMIRLARNIFFMSLQVSRTSNFDSNAVTRIGVINSNFSWFGGFAVVGLFPGRMINSDEKFYPGELQFTTAGEVRVIVMTGASCSRAYGAGLFIRRET